MGDVTSQQNNNNGRHLVWGNLGFSWFQEDKMDAMTHSIVLQSFDTESQGLW